MQCLHIAIYLLHSQSEAQVLVFFCSETDKESSKFPFAEVFISFTIGVCFQIHFCLGKIYRFKKFLLKITIFELCLTSVASVNSHVRP